jgi:hypothetical protein
VSLVAGEPFTIPPAGREKGLQSKMNCPPASMIGFDSRNRPYLVNTRYPEMYGIVYTLRNGAWVERSFRTALKKAGFTKMPTIESPKDLGTIWFDSNDGMYILLASPSAVKGKDNIGLNGNAVLVYSPDFGETFFVYPVNARPYLCMLETPCPGTVLDGPPTLITGTVTKKVDNEFFVINGRQKPIRFCSFNTMKVTFIQKKHTGLVFTKPVVVTKRANGITSHAGAMNIACSQGTDRNLIFVRPSMPQIR